LQIGRTMLVERNARRHPLSIVSGGGDGVGVRSCFMSRPHAVGGGSNSMGLFDAFVDGYGGDRAFHESQSQDRRCTYTASFKTLI
jgi:hypothetical protein